MKNYTKIIVFLIIACLLSSISLVSASEISDDATAAVDDYQYDIELNQENQIEFISDNGDNGETPLESISENENGEENQIASVSENGNGGEKLNAESDNTNVLNEDEDTGTFTDFQNDLMNSGNEFNMERDYTYDENDDPDCGTFEVEEITINGNNHVMDGAGLGVIFKFINEDSKIIINDLTFRNFGKCVLTCNAYITLNNVNFTDCNTRADEMISVDSGNASLNGCNFYANHAFGYIFETESSIVINNSRFIGNDFVVKGIDGGRGNLIIHNSIFENFTCENSTIIDIRGDRFELVNSSFINSKTQFSGGAILAKYFPIGYDSGDFTPSDPIIIRDCTFTNLTAGNDGGAIHIDMDSAAHHIVKIMNITNTNFTNCSSRYGGAISVMGGDLNIMDSNFNNCKASFEGGAIYSSWTNVNITDSGFKSNVGAKNAGGLYFDKGNLYINRSTFIDNKVTNVSNRTANAIYAHDVVAIIENSSFDNGGVGVYADFADNSQLINVIKNNDTFLMDNHDYILSVETPGIKLNFTGNEIIVDKLPSRFDARDWGWTTPGKVQGSNDDCWAFATTAALETALLKSTGVAYNLSENYVQEMQMKYSWAGDLRISWTGFIYSGLGYALSWLGAMPVDSPYDDRGLILDTDLNDERIHVQDAMIIYTGQDDTVDNIKRAIIKYGAVQVQAYVEADGSEIPSEGDDIAINEHGAHFITLIGWDDNYSESDGEDGEDGEDEEDGKDGKDGKDDEDWDDEDWDDGDDGDGGEDIGFIWFTKDSLGGFSTSSTLNFPDIDFYAIAPQRAAIAYIFENNNSYHVNYQTDLTGLAGFDDNYTMYSNKFTSKYDELIAAVGTYFNESGIDYSFDVFVNDEKVHSQTGVSEFAGFRTIVLSKYIPVKTGDEFKVVFTSNAVPYQAWSRVHYLSDTSLASEDGYDWVDFADLNKTVCLKVYTLKVNEDSFAALKEEINQSGEILNLTHDYTFNADIDSYILMDEDMGKPMIIVENEKLVINGNNHIIDGAGLGASFFFANSDGEIVINDVTFRNFNINVINSFAKITLNNVNFTDCIIPEDSIIALAVNNATLNECNFNTNRVSCMIREAGCNLTINKSSFIGSNFDGFAIDGRIGQLIIHNSVFENFTCQNASIIDIRADRFELVNSSFANSRTDYSGGAILAKYLPFGYDDEEYTPTDPIIIKDCTFTNLTARHDGGAIHIDMDSAANHIIKTMNVINTNFTDCSARFGGVLSVLGGDLNIMDSNFINGSASFAGGALYTSWSNVNITRSGFENNIADSNAGALYFDKGNLTVNQSSFTSNKALGSSSTAANAIYGHDVIAVIENSSFDNGGVGVYLDFADNSQLIDVIRNNDTFLMENHDYILSVETPGIKLNFTDNKIIVDKLPSRFDARDWGWTTPEKYQGNNDDCWAFATIATIETALLKRTGIAYELSQNYVQEMQLKYYPTGDMRISLTGFAHSGLGYALSWFGVLPQDSPYDDRGMITDAGMDTERIHVQDAMFIYTGQDDTIEKIKRAIMEYGAVFVQLYVQEAPEDLPREGDDIALMEHGTHFVSLIGWDDNDGDAEEEGGVWFTKDSLVGFTKNPMTNFPDIDNYALVPQHVAIVYIFENNINYHVNYQTDLTALTGFDGNYTSYSNEFTSKYDELIGAVGTYFNESGINYSFDVFVNNKKVHTQTGVSEYPGFRTIVLNKYIPVKKGDVFKVVFKSNSVPYQAWSRVHYVNGISLASADGNSWVDFASLNKTVCLKVYTVADDTKIINNKNIAVDYNGGSYFTVKVVTADGRAVGAGESVKFTINGKTSTVKTDNNGIARIKISEAPGKYTVTTTYRGKSYKNTVTVKHVLKVSKASVKNTDKKLILKATVKINGKLVKGKTVKFTFRGKTYKAKTNSKGVASVTIKKAVIKKLSKKSYTVKVTYLKDTVKGKVKVKQVLKAYKRTIKKSAKKFILKASLKINGKAAKKKLIKFKFRGKTYKAKTNKKGIAKVTVKKKVIKKLKKGKSYKVTVSYGKASVKTKVKVKR